MVLRDKGIRVQVDGEDLACSVRLSEFNKMLEPLIQRVLAHVQTTLAAAAMDVRACLYI
jgi:hypothetical protein